ncbi:MAG: hypothetical protein Q9228_002643 [Teloschistes exilis]
MIDLRTNDEAGVVSQPDQVMISRDRPTVLSVIQARGEMVARPECCLRARRVFLPGMGPQLEDALRQPRRQIGPADGLPRRGQGGAQRHLLRSSHPGGQFPRAIPSGRPGSARVMAIHDGGAGPSNGGCFERLGADNTSRSTTNRDM